jgi:flagellar protein FliT
MIQDNTIAIYESVAQLTSQMLIAARQQDWEKLAELEQSCADYVDKLSNYNNSQPLTGKALERKMASIKKILADDREIRDLVDPWMVKLSTQATIDFFSLKRNKHTLQ